jgi:hypothetical protein
MAAGRLIWPLIEPVLDATGRVVSGAVLKVYANRTTTLVGIFADMAMLTPVANPQTGIYASDSAGRFFTQTHAFWVPAGLLYSMRVDRPDGTFDVINDIQPQGGELASGGIPAGSMTIGAGQLTLSNTVSAPTTQVSVAVGTCRDSTNTVDITIAAPISKRIDQTWSAGTGNGLRDAGPLTAGMTEHIFAIDGPSVPSDVIGSTSPTSPLLPAGYTYFRRLGAILTDGSSLIRPFVQFGDEFELGIRSTDYAAQSNGGGVAFLRPITVPKGIKTKARIYFQSTGTANTTAYLSGVFDPDHGVPPAYGASTQWAQVRRGGFKDTTSSDVSFATTMLTCNTDFNANVYTQSSDSSELIVVGVVSWMDYR